MHYHLDTFCTVDIILNDIHSDKIIGFALLRQ